MTAFTGFADHSLQEMLELVDRWSANHLSRQQVVNPSHTYGAMPQIIWGPQINFSHLQTVSGDVMSRWAAGSVDGSGRLEELLELFGAAAKHCSVDKSQHGNVPPCV